MLTVASVHNQNNSDEKKNTSEILDSQEKTANNSTLQCSTPSKPSVSFSISPPQKGSFYSESTDSIVISPTDKPNYFPELYL